MKKVLLLGDSIRECYQDKVIERLGENYQVYRPNENCRFSAYTLNSLRYWFESIPYDIDIIHWNNGLWDVAHINDENRAFILLDDYIDYMKRIYETLRHFCPKAKIILATITPTRKEKESFGASNHFVNEIIEYNAKLKEVFCDKVDKINDLFNVVYPKVDEMICDDYIHLSEYGKDKCADEVVKVIKDFDNEKNNF